MSGLEQSVSLLEVRDYLVQELEMTATDAHRICRTLVSDPYLQRDPEFQVSMSRLLDKVCDLSKQLHESQHQAISRMRG